MTTDDTRGDDESRGEASDTAERGDPADPGDESPTETDGTRSADSGSGADAPQTSSLFRAFPDPLLRYEGEREAAVVRAVNPAFERTFDVDGSAVAGDPLADHLSVDAEGTTAADVRSRLDDGDRVVVAVRCGDDERCHFRLQAVSDTDDGADTVVVYTDVTDIERRARDLEARVERLERFVDVAAHDLRNPLDVAKIRVEAARESPADVHLEKAEAALDRIQRIVRDVLSVGSAEPDLAEGTSLRGVAAAAWSTVDTGAATLVLDDDLPTAVADADLLQHLFENLFRNSIEHGGGDVTVRVGDLPTVSTKGTNRGQADERGKSSGAPPERREDEARRGTKPTGGGFYVADDGRGVPPAERERVFEPGYSTADGNTGLGLVIVRQIAEDHGWRVSLTESESGGARFEFTGVRADGSD
ncbi:sensor histidine kinase [Halorussus sp. AFM4]|uniref:sensor histidine kinase n=1 Tax=Halorussus sp. AFM4 TaxID=3421651 RepID=UPI003EB8AB1B